MKLRFFGMKCWRYETTDEVWNCSHTYENVDDGMELKILVWNMKCWWYENTCVGMKLFSHVRKCWWWYEIVNLKCMCRYEFFFIGMKMLMSWGYEIVISYSHLYGSVQDKVYGAWLLFFVSAHACIFTFLSFLWMSCPHMRYLSAALLLTFSFFSEDHQSLWLCECYVRGTVIVYRAQKAIQGED